MVNLRKNNRQVWEILFFYNCTSNQEKRKLLQLCRNQTTTMCFCIKHKCFSNGQFPKQYVREHSNLLKTCSKSSPFFSREVSHIPGNLDELVACFWVNSLGLVLNIQLHFFNRLRAFCIDSLCEKQPPQLKWNNRCGSSVWNAEKIHNF